MIKAIIGLGNEGKEYVGTYHNVGTYAVHLYEHKEANRPIRFFEPTGFMNAIGDPITQFLKNQPVSSEEMLIIHDDSDLLIGSYKLSFGGGSAGHKGVQSVIDSLGTDAFWRLRVGIRDPKEQVRQKAGDFVLKKISKAEEVLVASALEKVWPEILKI